MQEVMSTMVFERVKHRLGTASPSNQLLRWRRSGLVRNLKLARGLGNELLF
jgi:hypothetical protein